MRRGQRCSHCIIYYSSPRPGFDVEELDRWESGVLKLGRRFSEWEIEQIQIAGGGAGRFAGARCAMEATVKPTGSLEQTVRRYEFEVILTASGIPTAKLLGQLEDFGMQITIAHIPRIAVAVAVAHDLRRTLVQGEGECP